MWTRKELKDEAKPVFKANYWKAVLVAFIVAAIVGGAGFSSSLKSFSDYSTSSHSSQSATSSLSYGTDSGVWAASLNNDLLDSGSRAASHSSVGGLMGGMSAAGVFGAVWIGLILCLVVLVVAALVVVVYVFALSPLVVGASRFFLRNLYQRAEIRDVAFGYDNNYKENVKTIFLRDLFIFLWSLLFIVPGIYKAYEYRMIPYLLADDPTMTKDRAFAESKRMMDGQKWKAFVLDLSFIGWHLLSAVTLGILRVLYVSPYQAQTNAALYKRLRYGAEGLAGQM